MKKILLYGHGGSNNHGCEAIVKTTNTILSKSIDKYETILSTIDYTSDEKFQTYADEYIKNKFHFNITIIDRIINKIYKILLKDENYLEKMNYKQLFKTIKGSKYMDVALSVGGDNYCCENPAWIYLINQALDNNNIERILWGCSVDAQYIDENMLRDLQGYKLIVARESMTYEGLQEAGLKQVVNYPDPAFLLEKEEIKLPQQLIKGNTIGINMSPLVQKVKDKNVVLDAYKSLIKHIFDETEYNVALIPHVNITNNSDYKAMLNLYETYQETNRICIFDDALSASQLKYAISNCEAFVCARTHASIAAYSSCVPTLVLSYSIKAKGIAKDLFGTFENYVLPVQELKSNEELVNKFKWLIENKKEIKEHLESFIPTYKNKILDIGKLIQRIYV